jgi:predicted DNA-binding transcriptional regulator
MTTEQITTIITNALTGIGVVFFVGMVIRGLKNRIEEMNKTIEVQQQTLKAIETRVLETNLHRRINTVNQLSANETSLQDRKNKSANLEAMLKNERTVYLLMSAYAEEDIRNALSIWRLLEAEYKSMSVEEISERLMLSNHTVRMILDEIYRAGCVEKVGITDGRTTYRAIIPKQ